MQKVLATKNKFRFVNDSILVPKADDLNYVTWERCNNLVHSWLINYMKSQIAESVVYIENVICVWNDLKERYLHEDRVHVAVLYQDLFNFKQGEMKVSDYFTGMRAMWKELDQFKPMPKCTCPVACACASMQDARKFKKEDQITQFLMGLNDQYKNVKSKILLMDYLPSINKVLSIVLQEERQQSYGASAHPSDKNEETNVLANAIDILNANCIIGGGRGHGAS